MNGQTVLLIGATGAIGIPLAKRLLELGHKVVVLARPQVDGATRGLGVIQEMLGSQVEVLFGDISKPGCDVSAEVIAASIGRFDAVIHAAGATQYYEHLREKTFSVNLDGTRNVRTLAEKLEIDRFVYISTCYVAGSRAYLSENDKGVPSLANNPYEASKIEAEEVVRSYYGTPLILRLGTVIGHVETGEIVNAGGYAGFVSGFWKSRDVIRRYPDNPFWAAVNPDTTLNLITNEWVTEHIIQATFSGMTGNIHLAHTKPVSMRWLFQRTFRSGELNLPMTHNRQSVERTALYDDSRWRMIQERVTGIVSYFGPYVTRDTTFAHERAVKIPGYTPPPKITDAVIDRQLQYMLTTLFPHKQLVPAEGVVV